MSTFIKKSIGELFLEKGLITPTQWEEVRADQQKTGDSIFRIIPRLGFLKQEAMVNFIVEHADVTRIDLNYHIIDPKLVDLVPEEIARKYLLIPILKIGNSLTCAMVDVFNIYVQDELAAKTGLSIDPVIATENEITKALAEFYTIKGDVQDVIKSFDEIKITTKEGEEVDINRIQANGDDAPVVKFVNLMIIQAVQDGASDIHIEPEENTIIIRTRIDGVLRKQSAPPKQFQAALISRIKILSKLDISETRKPQDGRIQLKIENKRIDIRVSFLPTVYGENVVMRLLDTSNILLGLEDIGFDKELLAKYKALLKRPNGIILVTGPTGSGKTTTLYSSLSTINDPSKSIVTVEDPVEYRLPGIRQTQVNPKVDLTFATGLRAILRQDPNIIMIGEIRDLETAQIAIQAALTGHLVLATLHTNNAAGAITRLIDIGVEPFLLSSSIAGVLAQRLVRLKCKSCSGKGCKTCNETGYKGRTSIFELLVFTEQIRDLAIRKASAEEINRLALSQGMQSMKDNGLARVAQGLTTEEEIARVTQLE